MSEVGLEPDEGEGEDSGTLAPQEGGDEDETAGGGEGDTPADLPPASDEAEERAVESLARIFLELTDLGYRPVAIPERVELADLLTFPDCPVCMGYGKTPHPVQQDPLSERCENCGGHGVVVTGSFVPGHEQRDCPTCLGQGYTTDTTPAPFVIPAAREPAEPAYHRHPGTAPPWPGAEWDSGAGIWRDAQSPVAAGQS